jgi:importin subunit alpha-1
LKTSPRDADGQSAYCITIEEAGGVDTLEKLQNHPSNEIYEKALKILEDYFMTEEEQTDSLMKHNMDASY